MEKEAEPKVKSGDTDILKKLTGEGLVLGDLLKELREAVELLKKLEASGGNLTKIDSTDEQFEKTLHKWREGIKKTQVYVETKEGMVRLMEALGAEKKTALLTVYTTEEYKTFQEIIGLHNEFKDIVERLRAFFKKRKVTKVNREIIKDLSEFAKPEPLRTKDFERVIIEAGQEKQKFLTKEGYYLQTVLPEEIALPGLNVPAVTVEFAKHMLNIFDLISLNNKKREKQGLPPEAKVEIALSEYARQRGKTEARIKRGGKFLEIYKQLFYTGATTSYIREMPDHYRIGHFYELEAPKERKGKWVFKLSQSYAEHFFNTQNYLPVWRSIINDEETRGKGQYKFFFVLNGVTPQLNTTGEYKPGDFIKVVKLLEKAKAGEKALKRDKEAFNKFTGGVDYTIRKCNNLQAVLFKGSLKGKPVTVEEKDFSKFNTWTYETFTKEILEPLGVRYCRELLVAFMGKHIVKPPEELPEKKTVDRPEAEQIELKDFF